MAFVVGSALIGGGASILGGLLGGSSAKKAAKIQAASAAADRALQEKMFNTQNALQEPFRQAGLTNQNELLRQFGLSGDKTSAGYGNLLRDFGAGDFQADPGYAFRMSEGLKGLDRQAAMRGGLISGAALKAAQGYGQNLASQEYQNAYDRYNTNRANRYTMLTGQQAVGQKATNAQQMAAGDYATNAGNSILNAGNARATGYMGQANAWGGALNSLANQATQYGVGQAQAQAQNQARNASIVSGYNAWQDPMIGAANPYVPTN